MTDIVPQEPRGVGRPKGSKNKITLLKLMAEETFRSKNIDRMLQVCDEIVTDALAGDKDCRKLVWSSIMSKGSNDTADSSGAIPTIRIVSEKPPQVVLPAIDVTPTTAE